MADVSHNYGSDLTVGPTGDIAVVDGTVMGQQRVLRRLLTAPGTYIWHMAYGAGLPSDVGLPVDRQAIESAVRSQIFLESAVAKTPQPTIDLVSDNSGTVYMHLRYTDATTGKTQVLNLQSGAP